jgi:hypothetical protein
VLFLYSALCSLWFISSLLNYSFLRQPFRYRKISCGALLAALSHRIPICCTML